MNVLGHTQNAFYSRSTENAYYMYFEEIAHYYVFIYIIILGKLCHLKVLLI